MYKPTDAEIDRLCAEVLGWRKVTKENPAHCQLNEIERMGWAGKNMGHITRTEGWANEITREWVYRRDFHPTTNRNALPELWKAVEKANRGEGRDYQVGYAIFIAELSDLLGIAPQEGYWESWLIHTAPARTVCIAALIALGKYPDDWAKE